MILLATNQSALDPAGPQAGRISTLWWIFFGTTATIYVIVQICMLVAALRKRQTEPQPPPPMPIDPARERRVNRVISWLVGMTAVVLFALLLSEFITGRKLYAFTSSPNQLEIKIIGHQWWWEVRYEDPVRSNMVITANEIHIPVGVPIRFDLESTDVIHSFWVPNLNGKKDLIPGHPTYFSMQADRPGKYEGQCAEFCGHQHAHMRFLVIAESRADFDKWREAQLKPAPEPQTDAQKRGRDVFINGSCIMCHTISGTPARGTVGPNLTHIGSSQTIAAATLANDPQNLRNWVHNAQSIKPGVLMPQIELPEGDIDAVVQYLESLK
jgi:cytochrome c oxidase subunit 2